jgi:hypothetical protein
LEESTLLTVIRRSGSTAGHNLLAAVIVVTLFSVACRRTTTYSAEARLSLPLQGVPEMSGRLHVGSGHLRIEWESFTDLFDLKQRRGWRIMGNSKTYYELGSKDLFSFAPQMTGGSLCPHTQVPSHCKLVGTAPVEGRAAKKWDVSNPQGLHVYYWTDEELGIALRMDMGDTVAYRVSNFHPSVVPDSMFRVPPGYELVKNPLRGN